MGAYSSIRARQSEPPGLFRGGNTQTVPEGRSSLFWGELPTLAIGRTLEDFFFFRFSMALNILVKMSHIDLVEGQEVREDPLNKGSVNKLVVVVVLLLLDKVARVLLSIEGSDVIFELVPRDT